MKKVNCWEGNESEDDENKTKLKTIIKTIQNKDPKNTISDTKKEWIETKKIQLETLQKGNIKHCFCVENFKFKSLHNYFKTEDNHCLMCDKQAFDVIHFLTECEGTRKMEMMLFSRRYRWNKKEIEDSLRHKRHSTHIWIVNWCLWLVRNQLVHEQDHTINTKQIGKIRETLESITQ